MKTGIIQDVSTIAKNANGESINVIVLRLMNGDVLIRGLKQFVTDLVNSNRLLGVNPDYITSVTHPAIQRELPRLKHGGKVTGEWKSVKAGQKFIDNNPQSPTFEQELEYTKDHIRVEGFLSVQPTAQYLQAELNAEHTAQLMAQLNGMFATMDTGASGVSGDVDDIPDEILDEILEGQDAPNAKKEETVE